MNRLLDGFWVYLLTLSIPILLGGYFQYRKINPVNDFESLVQENSKFAYIEPNPCSKSIYGDPAVDDPDEAWVKVNFYCDVSSPATNTLRFDALGNNVSFFEVLELLSKLNSFKYEYDKNNNSFDLGELVSNDEKKWNVYINNNNVKTDLSEINVKKKDVIDFKYE